MPSRSGIPVLSGKDAVTAEDINVLIRLVTGLFDARKAHGLAVKLTAFDGLMPTGAVNITDYALEVRNREGTRQKAFAIRNSVNKVIVACEDGVLKAVKDTAGPTTPTQVIVQGTPAGGILSGTYPNPTGTEYSQLYPTMCVLWFGSNSTAVRDDLHGGTNIEVLTCPGWVFCSGQTVKMRDGSTVVVPNMADKLPIGVGTVTKGATAGNTWAAAATISIAHTHTVAMSAHVHNVAHTHAHSHTSSTLQTTDHAHNAGTIVTTDHLHSAGTLVTTDHLHGSGSLATGIHSHTSSALTVIGNTGAPTTAGGSVQSGSGSTADVSGHIHGPGTLDVGGTTDGAAALAVGGFTGGADRSLVHGGATGAADRSLVTSGATAGAGVLAVSGAVTTDATAASITNTNVGAPDQTSSNSSVGSINIQNPVVGWYYIMKL